MTVIYINLLRKYLDMWIGILHKLYLNDPQKNLYHFAPVEHQIFLSMCYFFKWLKYGGGNILHRNYSAIWNINYSSEIILFNMTTILFRNYLCVFLKNNQIFFIQYCHLENNGLIDWYNYYAWICFFNQVGNCRLNGPFNEWVIVVWRQLSNFSAISWQEQVNFQWNDDEVHFVLDQQA
jgi:hypothetical protein